MVKLTICWTETAVRQRNVVFNCWIERNKSNAYAKNLNEKIKERTSLLLNNPELGRKTDFYNTRALSLGHYSILHQNIGTKIVVTAF